MTLDDIRSAAARREPASGVHPVTLRLASADDNPEAAPVRAALLEACERFALGAAVVATGSFGYDDLE
ncbi:MAG: hypothetical protein HY900_07675, partial [Deltaproteobacteria bacterium]|nr:hypothetical protein [Deltaproteobacteria bacterium]